MAVSYAHLSWMPVHIHGVIFWMCVLAVCHHGSKGNGSQLGDIASYYTIKYVYWQDGFIITCTRVETILPVVIMKQLPI